MSSIDGVKDIIGYADTVGKISYNKNLSQLRALNVFQIISPLINPKPSYSCKGEEFPQINRLELNRKVEICAYKFIDKPVPDLAAYVEVIDSFDIPNINFMPDRAILTAESIGSIPHLVQKVKSYRDAHFEIIGHVNYQSKRNSSFLQDIYKLSKERANAIYEILIENGISKSLLKFKGVGNSRPLIIDPKNDEERMKNMRVQILAFASVKKS
ncbi:MAG: OmpA family protein [Chitinophagaceae bacterium]